MSPSRLTACAVFAAMLLALAVPTRAADFYAGKRMTLVVAADVGGGYDIYARVLAPFLRRHIPGGPTIIVQNMPGSGGVRMANYLFADAAKDGTVFGMTLASVALAQLLTPAQVRYDAAQFGWIGTVEAQTNVLSVWSATSKARTIEDAKARQVVIGATNPDSFLFQEPALMNALLGTKFRIVKGYKGVHDINLAMERGEVDGQVSPWSSWKSDHAEWLEAGKLTHLIRTGAPADDLPGVPTLGDLVSGEAAKASVTLLEMSSYLGRSLALPPHAPEDRLALLRQALKETVEDEEFLAEMMKHNLPVQFRDGRDLQAYVADALRTPQAVVQSFTAAVTPR